MANASSKRIASQNEASIRNLRLGMLISLILSIILRLTVRRGSLPPSFGLSVIFLATFVPSVVIYRYLVKIGSVRRDTSGSLISSGEDLSQAGITEWCFDILYVTWACQIGSSLFGEWCWWLYLSIPFYAAYQVWNTFFRRQSVSSHEDGGAADAAPSISKRQEKLRKRGERGDSRIKVATGRR